MKATTEYEVRDPNPRAPTPQFRIHMLSSSSTSSITTTPVEWLRVTDACRVFSLSRSALYELIKSNAIKSSCLRKVGNSRGSRRINAESLRLYVERHVV